MLPQHKDARIRYRQQVDNSAAYVIPFIEETFPLQEGMKVMEVGCGEGGVLKPFLDRGLECVGVEMLGKRVELAKGFLKEYLQNGQVELITKDIYEVDFLGAFKNHFDLIILKDVIEHIHDQKKIMGYLKELLAPGGKIFLGFPPWYMPMGGHQQVAKGKIISKLPYIHLLPKTVYKGMLKAFGEPEKKIEELMEIKDTGISIERFQRILQAHHYTVFHKQFYLINPIYRFKFGWKPRKQVGWIAGMPFFRNFLTTCVYYLVGE